MLEFANVTFDQIALPIDLRFIVTAFLNMRFQTPLSQRRANRIYTLFHALYSTGNKRYRSSQHRFHKASAGLLVFAEIGIRVLPWLDFAPDHYPILRMA